MTSTTKKNGARQYALTGILLFSLFLILAGLQFITERKATDGLRASVEGVLTKWNIAAPTTGDSVIIPQAGWNYLRAFEAKGKGKSDGLIFAVRITGNSGPVTGVFYWDKKAGTSFCGIAGIEGATADQCGITPRVSEYWIRTIDRVCAERAAKGESK
jgi:hypothetical protein